MGQHHFTRVLITGTTSGLGRAFHRYYASAGKEVIEVNRRAVESEEELPVTRSEVLDITNAGEVFTFLMRLQRDNLIPDLFVLNAGINYPDNLHSFDYQSFSKVMNVNLTGVMTFISAIHRLGLKGRTIAVLSSTSNIVPNPGSIAYHLSKLNLKIAFDLLAKSDKNNYYKSVVLGPVHTNIQTHSPPSRGLTSKIFNLLAISPENATFAMAKFFEGPKSVFYYPKFSCAFYYFAKAILSFFPFLYKGTQLPTSKIVPAAT